MLCSVEISLYPIRQDYVTPIDAFIAEIEGVDGLDVEVGPMSTRVHGDYDRVMAVLTDAMKHSLADSRGAFVLKILGMDARAPHPQGEG